MKRTLALLALAVLALYVAVLVVTTASPLRFFGRERVWFDPPCDIRIGLVESDLVRRGIDPYTVWHGDVVLPGYCSGNPANVPPDAGCTEDDEPVNVHPPWFYTAILPLAWLPFRAAGAVHFLVMMGCLGLLLETGRRVARRYGCDAAGALGVGAGLVLAVSLPAFQDFCSGNWALVTLAAAVLMAVCLNRGGVLFDILAGLCWALIMLKPQVGLIFAVPLVMRRRWATCATAVAACLAASVPPALLTHTSVLRLILVTPGSNSEQFWGCGTFPKVLCDLMPQPVAILAGLAVGVAVCVWMTRRVGRTADWFVHLMPAATLSMSWTYSRCYGHVMAWFAFLCLALALVRTPRARGLWTLAAVSLLSLSRVYNFCHVLPDALPGLFPAFLPSEDWHYHLDSLNSTLDLALTALLCAWLARHPLRAAAPSPSTNPNNQP